MYDDGLHGVIFGKYNILACMMPAFDLAQLVGDLGAARQIAARWTWRSPNRRRTLT
jgi:hypothetical protein